MLYSVEWISVFCENWPQSGEVRVEKGMNGLCGDWNGKKGRTGTEVMNASVDGGYTGGRGGGGEGGFYRFDTGFFSSVQSP